MPTELCKYNIASTEAEGTKMRHIAEKKTNERQSHKSYFRLFLQYIVGRIFT